MGIIANELGHWHKMHMFKNIPIDMLHMCLFSWYITYFIKDVRILTEFGIVRHSFVMSFFILYMIWMTSFNLAFQVFGNYYGRKDEY